MESDWDREHGYTRSQGRLSEKGRDRITRMK